MRLIALIIVILAISGCDPVGCTEQLIQNNSERDLILFRISSLPNLGDTTHLETNSSNSINQVKCAKGGVVVNYSAYDSVFLTDASFKILKIYHPSDTSRNIYNIDDQVSWRIESNKKDLKYTFLITEEDLIN
jgi:hypothetical protein